MRTTKYECSQNSVFYNQVPLRLAKLTGSSLAPTPWWVPARNSTFKNGVSKCCQHDTCPRNMVLWRLSLVVTDPLSWRWGKGENVSYVSRCIYRRAQGSDHQVGGVSGREAVLRSIMSLVDNGAPRGSPCRSSLARLRRWRHPVSVGDESRRPRPWVAPPAPPGECR